MPGNSRNRSASKSSVSKAAGSGGRIRRSLAGKGPTPKAEDRPYHKAYRAKQEALRRKNNSPKKTKTDSDWVIGRNPVLEVLLADVPAKTIYVAENSERDDRLREIFKIAAERSIPMLQATRQELDRFSGGAVHQGVALKLPPYEYAEAEDVIEMAFDQAVYPLVVVLDSITDPHNLGAIVRSAAAFGAQGVVIPDRRSASMTPAAWKSSAGAAARIPVARCGNLNQTLDKFHKAGYVIVGLAGESETDIAEISGMFQQPVVVVVGAEGDGLSRLVRQKCDFLVSIPISSAVESLNASVALAITCYEISRSR